MNIQGKILSIVEGKLKVYEDLVLPGKVVEVVPNGTYFVLKGKEKTRYWFPRLVFETWYIGSNSPDVYKTKQKNLGFFRRWESNARLTTEALFGITKVPSTSWIPLGVTTFVILTTTAWTALLDSTDAGALRWLPLLTVQTQAATFKWITTSNGRNNFKKKINGPQQLLYVKEQEQTNFKNTNFPSHFLMNRLLRNKVTLYRVFKV